METLTTITVGKTTYTVEPMEDADMFLLTGPRGGQLVAAAYIDNENVFHAWRVGGTHADLIDPATGRTARLQRSELAGN